MSEISPVIQKEEEARVHFPALEVVAGCGGDTEEATAKRKIGAEVVAGKVLSQ